jgi:hypothetical protein
LDWGVPGGSTADQATGLLPTAGSLKLTFNAHRVLYRMADTISVPSVFWRSRVFSSAKWSTCAESEVGINIAMTNAISFRMANYASAQSEEEMISARCGAIDPVRSAIGKFVKILTTGRTISISKIALDNAFALEVCSCTSEPHPLKTSDFAKDCAGARNLLRLPLTHVGPVRLLLWHFTTQQRIHGLS